MFRNCNQSQGSNLELVSGGWFPQLPPGWSPAPCTQSPQPPHQSRESHTPCILSMYNNTQPLNLSSYIAHVFHILKRFNFTLHQFVKENITPR